MDLAVICAENIALLHLLHGVPSPPSRNRVEPSPHPHPAYNLPFETEQVLASTLAFLAGTKDGPENIPAVCLKELPASRSLEVLIAVNKAKWSDGDMVLNELVKGLQDIFDRLSSATNESLELALDNVFTAIIKLCNRRIQCRLRFTPNHRRKTKPSIRKVLDDSVNAIKQFQPSPASAGLYLEQVRDVTEKIAAWSAHQTSERLGELVTSFHDLSRVPGLDALLNGISQKRMELSARKSLVNIIGKVGRYRGVAVLLWQIAAKHSALRRTRVVSVRLPEDFFRRPSVTSDVSSLPRVVARFRNRYGGRYDMTSISQILGLQQQQANSQFVDQTSKSLKSSRIHAEIQLLFYCELENLHPPPRVICSSKDACFLCNAFVLMHGKFHMPKCHGKLYPGWRLPNTELGRRRQHFNDRLQTQVEDSLALLISRRSQTVYLGPNESTLLTLPRSRSTLNSENWIEEVGDVVTVLGADSSLSPDYSARSAKISVNRTRSVTTNSCVGYEKPNHDITSNSDSSPIPDTSPLPFLPVSSSGIFTLTPGQEVSVSIEPGMPTMFEVPGRLEVHIEYSSDSHMDGSSCVQPKVDCCIEWLTEQKRSSSSSRAHIIDAELIQGEVILERSEVQSLWFVAKGEILSVRAA